MLVGSTASGVALGRVLGVFADVTSAFVVVAVSGVTTTPCVSVSGK